MKMKKQTVLPAMGLLFLLLFILSCKGDPSQRTIELEPRKDMHSVHSNVRNDLHRVQVTEIRKGDKYMYLKVREGDQTYWVATAPGDIVEGNTYIYNEALRRTDFRSEALQEVFDTLYLVTRLVPESEAGDMKPSSLKEPREMEEAEVDTGQESATEVTLSELLDNPEAYRDSWVRFTAACTKVNEGIMNRNWVHLTTDQANGRSVVATTKADAAPGETLIVTAVVRQDRDFGSGYRYDILLEEAEFQRQ